MEQKRNGWVLQNRISDNEDDEEILDLRIELPHILTNFRYLGISSDEFVNGVFVNNLYIKDLEAMIIR